MVKYIILLALMVNIACCVSFFTLKEIPSFNKDLEEWEQFKQDHGKVYPSSEEEKLRFSIYRSNKRLVEKHNSEHAIGKHNFSMQMNHFGDMLHTEFVDTMNGYRHHMRRNFSASNFHGMPDWVKIPDTVDWRDKGAVTPVKDQGHCGSCWAFSSTGALEGQHFRKTGKLVSLSEQNLVDCSTDFGNEGCNGGLMNNAFQYVKDNHGIDTEVSYPYDGEDEQCHFKSVDVGATDTGYMNSPEGDEEALKEMVATHGPVAVAIDASHKSFMFYDRGVYSDDDCTSDELDHGVLLVGYGTTESGEDYWLVKNSWSETWGVDGYVKMARNKDNMCGIASSASIPLV